MVREELGDARLSVTSATKVDTFPLKNATRFRSGWPSMGDREDDKALGAFDFGLEEQRPGTDRKAIIKAGVVTEALWRHIATRDEEERTRLASNPPVRSFPYT